MLLGADILGRAIMIHQVIPVGVMTAVLGAPVFLYLFQEVVLSEAATHGAGLAVTAGAATPHSLPTLARLIADGQAPENTFRSSPAFFQHGSSNLSDLAAPASWWSGCTPAGRSCSTSARPARRPCRRPRSARRWSP